MPLLTTLTRARKFAARAIRARQAEHDIRRVQDRLGAPADVKVVVYFADGPVNLYQMRQWYAPLKTLAERVPVAVLARSAGSAIAMVEESPLPVEHVRQVADLERFVAEHEVRIVLYVNQNAKNFQMMRYGRMWHVFINHGESDKMYMTTNQFKAYDYALIAGDAARARLTRALWDYDLDKRAIPIGRPQADHFAGQVPYPAGDRTVVLYAPTWEGDRPQAAYGSIASHGVALVRALLASPRYRVVYRPHPRSGVLDTAYAQANRQIIDALAAANRADPNAHHVHDTGAELGWQLAAADVAITDISAMVYDRLATGKPLLVTRPVSPAADVDESGYLGDAEWLEAADAAQLPARLDTLLTSTEARARLEKWVSHYFGDTTPGAATERFHAAIDLLLARWDEHAAQHVGDPA
ncbi:CDP-glycerol glycerophosphotransferase family protein [Herbiconiux sp. SYSU D00978]|uniref:CDP-glycerol glycerophosphotransferase family protein n=1 Tax=Herbiconiux sp. SYSU D00978 TaxID=2812562 RepID=UPI001A96FEAF|nr:CDP-glycerol glycerophosphotransferase family protein [Herbiconiux sp. SYSU D00978]